MSYKIKEVADMVGISVRMLHHYDKIGLFNPESLSPSGYRLYTDKDLEKLQQVLFFKELDFSLQEIKDIIDNPEFDRKLAFGKHKELLVKKRERLDAIIESIGRNINLIERGETMNKKEMFEAFDMSEIDKAKKEYAKEAEKKYGGSDAYRESAKKTAKYGKEDWARITSETEAIYKRIINAMDKGPDSPEVQSAVEEHRRSITKNFYNCTPDIYRGLADLYISDERFTRNIDKYKEGLAAFLSKAMQIYCDRL